ncbi:MAG: glycosyltransferase [Desulfobacterales bacterium]|nr:MAG: glycosyltransferase [Desulfobacterales bacterium]
MQPLYSIIIPAYNEEQWVDRTLSTVKKAMKPLNDLGEIIVVDNSSTDNTARIARQHNVQVVFEPINQISRARNAGASVAQGRFFIFLDADTSLSLPLLQTALHYLSSHKCCGGGCVVEMDTPMEHVARKALDMWNWFSITFGFAAGCFIYCLKEGFEAVGGFSEKVYASEEIWFSRRLQSWGKKRGMDFCIIEIPPIVTSSRKLQWFSPFRLVLPALLLMMFPFLLRFRLFCSPWYYRPK